MAIGLREWLLLHVDKFHFSCIFLFASICTLVLMRDWSSNKKLRIVIRLLTAPHPVLVVPKSPTSSKSAAFCFSVHQDLLCVFCILIKNVYCPGVDRRGIWRLHGVVPRYGRFMLPLWVLQLKHDTRAFLLQRNGYKVLCPQPACFRRKTFSLYS